MIKATTITISDPQLMAEVEAARDFVEFRDPSGKLLSVMTTNLPGSPPPELLARIKTLTAEELAERRNQPGGKTTEEVFAQFNIRRACTP